MKATYTNQPPFTLLCNSALSSDQPLPMHLPTPATPHPSLPGANSNHLHLRIHLLRATGVTAGGDAVGGLVGGLRAFSGWEAP